MDLANLAQGRCQHNFFTSSKEAAQLCHWGGQGSLGVGVSRVDGWAANRTIAVEVRAHKERLTNFFLSVSQEVPNFTRDRLVADVIKDETSPPLRHL